MKPAKLTTEEAWGFNQLMVIAAFRYCVGRQTYIVGACADWLIEVWPLLSDNTKRFAAAYAAAALTKTTPNAWQAAVQDRLVIVHGLTAENANDPRKAVADLIRIQTQIALDPAVSSDAHALIAAEREAICPIVYGHCGSDNDAQRIVDAIRTRSAK